MKRLLRTYIKQAIRVIVIAGAIFGIYNAVYPITNVPSSHHNISQTQKTAHTYENDGFDDWSKDIAPNYVKSLGSAHVDHEIETGYIQYGGIDSLGRTTWVAGRITYDMVEKSAGWREEFKADADEISGWKNPTTGKSNNRKTIVDLPNGKTYSGYFYNRSHLIADSLGGVAERKNLICGTRMQNVGANDGKGGMAYIETIVRDYLYKNEEGVVYYAATPVYYENELVPRVVIVDAKSDDGEINMRVEVFNAQKGYTIDYATGAWTKS